MKRIAAVLLGLAMMICMVRAEEVAGPEVITEAAYGTAKMHFGFTPDTVRQEKLFLSPDLYAALMKKARQPVAKGDAPDIEGDVFFNAQDIPDKYEVGSATINGTKAEVPVLLRWGSEKRRYVVRLVQINGGWKISEVDYGKDGKLSDLLK